MALKPNGGTYCIQTGGPAAANMNDRIKGMTETLPADKWKQVAGCPLYNNDDFPLSITQLTDLLAKYPKIDAVLDAGGAPQMEVKAYKELMGKYKDRLDKKDLVMLFVETLPMQMDDLKAGLSHGQVGQRPFEMGYKAIYLLNDLTQGKTIPDPVTIDSTSARQRPSTPARSSSASRGVRRQRARRLDSVAALSFNRMVERLAALVRLDLPGDERGDRVGRGDRRVVRADIDRRVRPQARVLRQRLALEHVERCAFERARIERIEDVGFDLQAASSGG